MNSSIDRTSTEATRGEVNEAVSRCTPSSLRRICRSRTRRLVAIAALAVPVAVSVVAASSSPAAASTVYSDYLTMSATVTCDGWDDTALVTTYVTPKQGYGGTWVRYRNYLSLTQNGYTAGAWGAWSQPVQLGAYGTMVQYGYIHPGNAIGVAVYTEVAYWTGSAWVATRGTWATPYQEGYYWSRYTGGCVT